MSSLWLSGGLHPEFTANCNGMQKQIGIGMQPRRQARLFRGHFGGCFFQEAISNYFPSHFLCTMFLYRCPLPHTTAVCHNQVLGPNYKNSKPFFVWLLFWVGLEHRMCYQQSVDGHAFRIHYSGYPCCCLIQIRHTLGTKKH